MIRFRSNVEVRLFVVLNPGVVGHAMSIKTSRNVGVSVVPGSMEKKLPIPDCGGKGGRTDAATAAVAAAAVREGCNAI